MTWKDRLTIATCIFTITLCSFFSLGWILNSTGVLKVDLPILIQALQVIERILEFLLGGA